jgi:hypothetical protein
MGTKARTTIPILFICLAVILAIGVALFGNWGLKHNLRFAPSTGTTILLMFPVAIFALGMVAALQWIEKRSPRIDTGSRVVNFILVICLAGTLGVGAVIFFNWADQHLFSFESERSIPPKSNYIGQAYFPRGDSIEITSVERIPEQMVVKGHYNLVSHDNALLALYITSTNKNVPEDATQRMQIAKGRGDFELIHSHLVPGLPHVSMYADGASFAALYFGTKVEALEESKAGWITNEAPATVTTDQIIVEHAAMRMLAAIRDKDDDALKELATERVKGWRESLPQFAFEMREKFHELTGKPFDMHVSESLVRDDTALVKCAGPKELNGIYLALFFIKTEDGWKNCWLHNAPPSVPLEDFWRQMPPAATTQLEDTAVSAAQKWLTLIDAGSYSESWKEASAIFQGAVTEPGWENSMNTFRKLLGDLVSRKLKSAERMTEMPGAPDGQYVLMQFETSFINKKSAIETVTFMLGKDGQWRAAGYYIK